MRRLLPFLFLFLPSCPSTPTPPAPGAATCTEICARGATLDCAFANPTPKGASCKTVCENLQASGLPMWNLACMATAKSCAAMDDCQP
jgi:hypothetical protein